MIINIPFVGKQELPFKALQGITLDIGTGMYGLLGPNGAGKSTLMRIISGIFEQSYGKIYINGIPYCQPQIFVSKAPVTGLWHDYVES